MSADITAAGSLAFPLAVIEAHADPIGAMAIESAVRNAMMVRKHVTSEWPPATNDDGERPKVKAAPATEVGIIAKRRLDVVNLLVAATRLVIKQT